METDKLIGERPSPSPFIEFVWRYVTPEDCTIVDRAHEFWGLVFRGRGEGWQAFLIGPLTRAEPITCSAGQVNWGVTFKAYVTLPGLAKSTLLNARTPLAMDDAGDLIVGQRRLPLPEDGDGEGLAEMLASTGVIEINEPLRQALAGNRELSKRSRQRHYRNDVGLSLLQKRQIDRARQAFAMLTNGVAIADVVFDCGYTDQPHLTRSLKLFAGHTPGAILSGVDRWSWPSSSTPRRKG